MVKLGKRTARLVREAAIAGFIAGNRLGPPRTSNDVEYPTDAAIWVATLRTARFARENFPTLSAVARESEELAEDDRRARAATVELLNAIMAVRDPKNS